MPSENVRATLQSLVEREQRKPHTFSVLLAVQNRSRSLDFAAASGQAAGTDTPYFIASVTKLYTTAIIMRLSDQGQIDLQAPAARYLPAGMIDGLHVINGVDDGPRITVWQLLTQTSGLADYFEGRPIDGGTSLLDELKQGRDQTVTPGDALGRVRRMRPPFRPGDRRAHYSDTNFLLLGEIIQCVTGRTTTAIFREQIFAPLGLAQTYVYDHAQVHPAGEPLPFYFRDQPLCIPLTMSSFVPDGGIVSTLADSITFLRAFYDGILFDAAALPRLMARWNPIIFPLISYGGGMMRLRVPRLMTPIRALPEMIGHFGASGTFAFYAPGPGIYAAGALNQIDPPSRAAMFLMRVMNALA